MSAARTCMYEFARGCARARAQVKRAPRGQKVSPLRRADTPAAGFQNLQAAQAEGERPRGGMREVRGRSWGSMRARVRVRARVRARDTT